MTQDELLNRLYRIYAAVGASTEFDMAKLPGRIIRDEKVVGVFQDFSGGLTEHELSNAAQSVIHNIASLHDHLKSGRDRMEKMQDKSIQRAPILWICRSSETFGIRTNMVATEATVDFQRGRHALSRFDDR